MKTRKLMFAIGACAAVVLASCGSSESTTSRVKNAALGKPAVLARGSCADGVMIEGFDEDDCVISIKLSKVTRKASLQVLNTDDDWDTISSAVAKRGVAKFEVFATDDDGAWLDGQYTYRVFAARNGRLPEFISATFDVVYGTELDAEYTDEMGAQESEMQSASPEMQSAMDDIEKPTTKFDDNCWKIFNKADCSLMFRLGRGPDFTALGKSKWVKMCSTLLNRPERECDMEFKFATEMQKSNNPPGYDPMNPNSGEVKRSPGLDPVKLAAACAAIGMAEADCRAVIQAGPIAALQKFGDKAETFCKAYAAKSCAELMAVGIDVPLTGGNTMRPGQQGMQPPTGGNTMRPGQQGMQPPTGGNTMRPGQQGMQPPTAGNG
jgi:hypothetical protein